LIYVHDTTALPAAFPLPSPNRRSLFFNFQDPIFQSLIKSVGNLLPIPPAVKAMVNKLVDPAFTFFETGNPDPLINAVLEVVPEAIAFVETLPDKEEMQKIVSDAVNSLMKHEEFTNAIEDFLKNPLNWQTATKIFRDLLKNDQVKQKATAVCDQFLKDAPASTR
jgi:hypothetical protein